MILEDIMNTSSLNKEIKELKNKMFLYIDEKQYDEAEKIADEIDEKTNGCTEGIAKARILIARGKRREKNNQK